MKLSIRTTPYFQWLVESRTGRKRKVLGRFGDERNAKQFLAGLTKGSVDLDNGKKPNGHRARAGVTPAAGSNLPTVESGISPLIRSSHSLQHAAAKTACMTAIVAGLALAVPSATKAADGGQSISAGFSETHPDARATRAGAGMVARPVGTRFDSSRHKTAGPAESNVHSPAGFSAPASGPVRAGEVGNRNAQVSDAAFPQPIAGGGANFKRALAIFSVSLTAVVGGLLVASCALSGRLEDPR